MRCNKCNKADMVEKTNKANGEKFLACSGYPNCKNTESMPEESVPEKAVQDDEFHLTIEQVRSNALDSAIKVTKKLGTDDYTGDLMGHALQFERYIKTGEIGDD